MLSVWPIVIAVNIHLCGSAEFCITGAMLSVKSLQVKKERQNLGHFNALVRHTATSPQA